MPSHYYNICRVLEDAPKEYAGRPLLCLPSEPDARDYQYTRLCGLVQTEEPVAIDYRPNLPGVFEQGARGSCVSCASVWTVKAWHEINQGDYPTDGLSAAFLYSLCKQNDGMPNEEGTQPRVAMKMLQQYGVCPERVMPYSTLSSLKAPNVPTISALAYSAATAFKIQTYAQLCGLADKDRSTTVQAMRQALKNEGPFMAALLVCSNFAPDSNGFLPLPSGAILGGHAVGIVGDLPDKQAFILRNSWGKDWGLEGYAYLPYSWITSRYDGGWYFFEAWTAVDMPTPKRAKQIVLTPGDKTMLVDGVSYDLDQPVEIDPETNRALLPIRALAGNLGCLVEWANGQIKLTSV